MADCTCARCGKSFPPRPGKANKYCSTKCYRTKSPLERFMEKIVVSPSGCWEWTGSKNEKGYGMIGLNGKVIGAHKFIYEYHNGPVPKGKELDHSCNNRGCANPVHIRPMSHRDNVLRGDSIPAGNSRKTHCIKGHELSGSNVHERIGRYGIKRICMECERTYGRNRRMQDAQL
jgi:hypothetical protein